jgi:hypothetical protein
VPAVNPRDTQLSHAILNPTTAALQGELAFARAMARFTRSDQALDLLDDVKAMLEQVRGWWKDLAGGIPLVRAAEPVPELTGDGKRVLELLESAIDRWERLADEIESLHPEASDRNDEAFRLVVAANADRAFYAHQLIAGTIAAGTMMGDPTIGGRLADRVSVCNDDLASLNEIVTAVADGGVLTDDQRDSLAVRTLTLPPDLRLRAAEARWAAGVVTGRLDHRQVGIPDEEAAGWERIGFPPPLAAKWRAAGFEPDEAMPWARAGVDPAMAAACRLQGIPLDDVTRGLGAR